MLDENKTMSIAIRPLVLRITEAQRRNAITFLRRAPLKGEEAQALVEIMHLFVNAKPEPRTEPPSAEPLQP
jgi:hypothetical protein